MSRIYFNSLSQTAEVTGSERAWFNYLIDRIGFGLLDVTTNQDLLELGLPKNHEMRSISKFQRSEQLWKSFGIFGEDIFQVEDETINFFTLNLNSVMLVGDDAMKLAARLQAQCELHCWVDGPNRAWLANIIETASPQVFRPDSGWESVIELLRLNDREPVVLSESIGSGFPAYHLSDLAQNWVELSEEEQDKEEENQENWYELSSEEKWALSMPWLRKQKGNLELTPENWQGYGFGNGYNALSLLDELRKKNL